MLPPMLSLEHQRAKVRAPPAGHPRPGSNAALPAAPGPRQALFSVSPSLCRGVISNDPSSSKILFSCDSKPTGTPKEATCRCLGSISMGFGAVAGSTQFLLRVRHGGFYPWVGHPSKCPVVSARSLGQQPTWAEGISKKNEGDEEPFKGALASFTIPGIGADPGATQPLGDPCSLATLLDHGSSRGEEGKGLLGSGCEKRHSCEVPQI